MSDAPIPFQPDAAALPAPKLWGTVDVRHDREDVYDALAADLMVHATNCVRTFGDFHVALSGGSTPFPFYERLMIDPRWRGMPWSRTHLWVVDERRVPFDHDRSNWRQIHSILGDHAGIPPSHQHPIEATLPDAAERYERELRAALGQRERGHDRLDFVLLGMGDNGHTASLFPRNPVLDVRDRLVSYCDGPDVTPPPRVTMTYPLINAARLIAVLVMGAGKAEMVRRVDTGTDDFHELPIKGIHPAGGVVHWYLDAEACGR
jgi:6-phosphogluconolactonase